MECFGVEMIWASKYYHTSGKLVEHAHPFYQMIYFIDGKGRFACGESTYPFRSGTLLLIRPQQRHSFVADDATVIKTVDIKFEVKEASLAELIVKIDTCSHETALEILVLMERIREEGAAKRPFFREVACLYLVQLLYALVRTPVSQALPQTADPRLPPQRVPDRSLAAERARQMIAEHYMDELDAATISACIGFSKKYVGQAFIQAYQCTIAEFLKQTRIEKAKQLMMYSEYSLKEIAAAVGFKSIHHFNRVFKQAEGITPGNWYAQERQGIRKEITF